MDAPRRYLRELKSDLGFYPMWLPHDPVALGEFGVLEGGRFRRMGVLADLGIPFRTQSRGSGVSIRRSRGVSTRILGNARADGGVIDAAAGLAVEFSKKDAWLFAALGDALLEIENIFEVTSAVLAAYAAKSWKKEWVLVTEVRRVATLNVLIARNDSVHAELTGEGKVATPEEIVVSGDLSIACDSKELFVVQNAHEATPLYMPRMVKGLFQPGLQPISAGSKGGEIGLLPVNEEDFFGS